VTTVACVWTGGKYSIDYVARLRAMVARHLVVDHRFICLTDHGAVPDGVERIEVPAIGLERWWAKMALFAPAVRGPGPCLYLDLDTVVVGDLGPLAAWAGTPGSSAGAGFAICRNFHAKPGWCRYGSCAMTFADGWGEPVWRRFVADHQGLMARSRWGDQGAIELLVPDAVILQDRVPDGYFVHYKAIPPARPDEAAVVVFGGKARPHDCTVPWVREAWG